MKSTHLEFLDDSWKLLLWHDSMRLEHCRRRDFPHSTRTTRHESVKSLHMELRHLETLQHKNGSSILLNRFFLHGTINAQSRIIMNSVHICSHFQSERSHPDNKITQAARASRKRRLWLIRQNLWHKVLQDYMRNELCKLQRLFFNSWWGAARCVGKTCVFHHRYLSLSVQSLSYFLAGRRRCDAVRW